MVESERTLVIFLTMHRSGSSLAAGTFERMGLSLGPFEPLGPSANNPYGHFEVIPFLRLNEELQNLVFGFDGDLPESEQDLAKFIQNDGRPEWPELSEELLGRGKALIETLINSGTVSGFKDPRTVLLWPYWRRVFSAFPEVRVVPVVLLRSPHEIAMSLFARSGGDYGYWPCLDVVGVNYQQLQAIVEGWHQPVPRIRFGGADYFDDLEEAVRACGLEWTLIRPSACSTGVAFTRCRRPSTTPPSAFTKSLCGSELRSLDGDRNATQLEADGRAREARQSTRLRQAKAAALEREGQLFELQERLSDQQERLSEQQERLNHVVDQSRLSASQFELAREEWLLAKEQYEADLDASHREEQRLQAVCEDQRKKIEMYHDHPILGRALRSRWWLKRNVFGPRSRSAS